MGGHLIQLWNLYLKSKKETNKQLTKNDEESKTLQSSTDH
jgi:hypothetical protein